MTALALFYQEKWLLICAILLAYAAVKVRTYRRLSQFKGPFSTGWSEIWHIRTILSLRSHHIYKAVTDKYGTISRIAPNELVTNSPELIVHMNAVRSRYTRTPWFYRGTRVEPGKDHLFSELDEAVHTKRKQQMASGYSGKENLSLEPSIDGRVAEFLELIRSKYLSTPADSKPMDLAQKVEYFTLDVISLVGYGQAFGDLKADADVDGYLKASDEGISLLNFFCATGLMPYFQWPPIARLLGPSEKDKTGHGKMMATAQRMINERLRMPTDTRSDMLASFIRHGMKREELFTEAYLQILAGSGTTATAIRSIMLYLVSHPRVYMKLQAEIDAAVASGIVSTDGVISEANAKALPYLQAVIREGMRIHPPVMNIVPKTVPKGGDTVVIDGKSVFLPGGTNVGYDVLGVNRRKDLFGDDVDEFRPERWMLAENEKNSNRLEWMRRTTEMIFGYGKYQCLGKNIAFMEINKMIFELLRHFDWAVARPEKPWKSENYMGIIMQGGLWMLVSSRT